MCVSTRNQTKKNHQHQTKKVVMFTKHHPLLCCDHPVSVIIFLLSLVLLLCSSSSSSLFVAVDAATTPTCRMKRQVYAGDIRTQGQGGVLISVYGDTIDTSYVPTSQDIAYLNGNMSNTQGFISASKKLVV